MKNAHRVLRLDLDGLKRQSLSKLTRSYFTVAYDIAQKLVVAIENDDQLEVVACDALLNQYLLIDIEQYLNGEEFSVPTLLENIPVAKLRQKACTQVENSFYRDLDRRLTEVGEAVARRDKGKLKMLCLMLDVQFGINIDAVLDPVERSTYHAVLLGS
jgi:hypothetical protein